MTGPAVCGRARRERHDAGQATVDLVGVVVLVLLAAVLCVQAVTMAQVFSTTQAAVRDAARAASTGADGRAAFDAKAPEWVRVESFEVHRDADEVVVEARVRLPLLGRGGDVGGVTVERSATFPRGDA